LAVRIGLKRGIFSTGNGDKVLKRLINFARQIQANFSDQIFYQLLSDWPSVRQTILLWWQNTKNPEAKLHLLSQLISSKTLVDDAATMDVAISLVAARLPKTSSVEDEISKIVGGLEQTSKWGFYSKVWILSKYGSLDELMTLIESTVSVWVTQEHLSRLVAGVFPRFLRSPALKAKLEAIIGRERNSASMSVLQFHRDLVSTTSAYTAIKAFILAKNPSLPNNITHSKFMMLLSLINNSTIAPSAVANLKKQHQWALSDSFYSTL
jgi:hypothetical protein